MLESVDDTIAAIATAPGGAAQGMIRLSGPKLLGCLERWFEPDNDDLRQICRPTMLPGTLRVGPPLDQIDAKVYFWPGTRSYTREPIAEVYVIGSPPILESALRKMCASGARLAAPGEFTTRAFLAGRLDLAQAEAVLGVIDADDDRQLSVALGQLAGGISGPLHALRESLLMLLAHLEAGLDFVDEDIEFISVAQLDRQVTEAFEVIGQLVEQISERSVTGELPRVALIGWPNVGKSSLFNALIESDAAIVSGIAGTTRDYITGQVAAGKEKDHRWQLIDTAGEESITDDSIAGLAQQQMSAQHRGADLVLLCIESCREPNEWERRQLAAASDRQIVVLTKCDQSGSQPSLPHATMTSVHRGTGIEQLRDMISRRLADKSVSAAPVVQATAVRCLDSLRRCTERLQSAQNAIRSQLGDEIISLELRSALDELGQVVGAVYTDDVLDRVFGQFCIGK